MTIHRTHIGPSHSLVRPRPRRLLSWTLVLALFGASASLVTAAPPAAAYTPRTYESQLSGTLGQPKALTFDPSNRVLVKNEVGAFIGQISEFNSEGEELPTKIPLSYANSGLADDYLNHNIYAPNGSGTAEVYDSTGTFVEFFPQELPDELTSAAVNNFAGPTRGLIYVSSRTNGGFIESFNEKAEPVAFSRSTELNPPSYIEQNKLTGTPTGGAFTQAGALAVGRNGEIYVVDSGKVDEFEASGVFVKEITGVGAPGGFNPSSIAVDPTTGDLLASSGSIVDEFSALGVYLGDVTGRESPSESFLTVGGIAVNSKGYLYVSDWSNSSDPHHRFVDIYSPAFILPKVAYPGVSDATATSATEDSLTLNAEISPAGGGEIETCVFEYVAEANYRPSAVNPFEAGQAVACAQPLPYSGTSPLNATATVSGIVPGIAYRYRVLAGNSNGTREAPVDTFQLQAPTFSRPAVTDLTASAADLNVEINPQGADTEYHFEYGATTAYGRSAPIPEEDIGSFGVEQTVSIHITDLEGSIYHFRVVAHNIFGTTVSEDQTFDFFPPKCPNEAVREQTGAEFLPDCRAYELVSPADAGGTLLYPVGPNSPQATSPSRFAFGGILGKIPGTGDPADVLGDLYVSTRTDSGWVTHYVGVPGSEIPTSNGPPSEEEFGLGGIERSPGGQLTDLDMNEFMSWSDGDNAGAYGSGRETSGVFAPYVWTSDGASLGRFPTNLGTVPGGEGLRGEVEPSPDFSHYFFTSEGELAFAPNAPAGSAYDDNVAEDTVDLISKKANGEPIEPTGGKISFPLKGASSDGSRVLMAVPAAGGGSELYMRVGGGAGVTFELAPGHGVDYAGMTADGSKVYFTSSESLTTEDEDSSENLYVWSEAAALAGQQPLTLISKPDGSTGTGTPVCPAATWTTGCGTVTLPTGGPTPTVSDSINEGGPGGNGHSDNSIAAESGDIYFYSPRQLDGSKGIVGERNLYVYHAGEIRYVTTLNTGPYCVSAQRSCSDGPVVRIQVSPTGSHMAFLTASKVTAYESEGHLEMYTFEPGSGKVQCASCIPSGAPPTSSVEASANGLFMTNDGRVFFSTGDPLVAQDTDGLRDVYEYVEGRAQLVSSGTSNKDEGLSALGNPLLHTAGLAGVSANGIDVYFSTFEPLVSQDHNGTALRFYDARTDGGFPTSPPPAPCAAADECAGLGSSEGPSSQNGTGAELGTLGNVTSPIKRHRHKASKAKRHRHKAAKTKRATRHRQHRKAGQKQGARAKYRRGGAK